MVEKGEKSKKPNASAGGRGKGTPGKGAGGPRRAAAKARAGGRAFEALGDDAVAVLHIGKTGGSYLKSVVRANMPEAPYPVALCGHAHDVESIVGQMGPAARLAFVFRDPESRFLSGFLSRQRQGRPTYQSLWSPGEAAVFGFFRSPDALARALGSADETEKSMAIFGMETISHLRRNYQFYFGKPEAFDRRAGQVVACLDLKDLDANIDWFLTRLGFAAPKVPEQTRRHEYSGEKPVLSEEGRANLRAYWATEFELFERMRALSAQLRG